MSPRNWKMAALGSLLTVCIACIAACGTSDGGSGFFNPGGSGTSGTTGSSGTTGTSSGTTGGPTAQVGRLQLNLRQSGKEVKNRAVPSSFTSVRITGYDINNAVVFTETRPVANSILQPDVPVNVVTAQLEFLNSAGVVVGKSNLPVTITSGGTFVIEDPSYDNVVVAVTGNFLNGTYIVTGADSGTVKGGQLNGTLTFDGQGRVTNGTITRRDAIATSSTTVFRVSAGTYAITADRTVDVTLTTDRYALKLHGRASLNTLGESVYSDIFGDNGTNDALSGFVYLQKQGLASASVSSGQYNITGMGVGFFGTPGIYNGNLTMANGAITGGSLDGPTGSSFTVQSGSYSVSNGVLTGTAQLGGMGNLTFTGSVGSDNYISFNGLTSTSSDSLYFTGMPAQGLINLPNVPSTMSLVGMRTVQGGLDGSASISIGGGKLLGGAYTLYQAVTIPILPSSSTLTESSFVISDRGVVTGSSTASSDTPAVRLVRGFFSQDGSVYFGSLDSGQGALAGGQGYAVLAK